MRYISIITFLILLAGCQSQSRIYFHNNSRETITINSQDFIRIYNNRAENLISLKPGNSKWIILTGGNITNCIELENEGQIHAYLLKREYLTNSWKATRYGVRFDIYYEYGHLFLETKSQEWIEIESIINCGKA